MLCREHSQLSLMMQESDIQDLVECFYACVREDCIKSGLWGFKAKCNAAVEAAGLAKDEVSLWEVKHAEAESQPNAVSRGKIRANLKLRKAKKQADADGQMATALKQMQAAEQSRRAIQEAQLTEFNSWLTQDMV